MWVYMPFDKDKNNVVISAPAGFWLLEFFGATANAEAGLWLLFKASAKKDEPYTTDDSGM